ncbi:hypothetical protein AgCh_017660 [Apium graveolens]
MQSERNFKSTVSTFHNNAAMELMRGVRSQLTELISGLGGQDLSSMSLGLSHSLSRYKLKFSADKAVKKIARVKKEKKKKEPEVGAETP